MVKVNKCQSFGRPFQTTFYTETIQSCSYFPPGKKLFLSSLYDILCTHRLFFRHQLKDSLLGVPRKMVLLKFKNIKSDE